MYDIISLSIIALALTFAVGYLSKRILLKLGSFIFINKFSEAEQFALLEAALMTIYVDGTVELTENMALETIIKQVEWKFSVDKEMDRIANKALEALQDADKMRDYLHDIKAKVSSPKTAKKIFEVCDDLSVQGSVRKGFLGKSTYKVEINYLNQLRETLETVSDQRPKQQN